MFFLFNFSIEYVIISVTDIVSRQNGYFREVFYGRKRWRIGFLRCGRCCIGGFDNFQPMRINAEWLKSRIKPVDFCLFVIPILCFFVNNKIKRQIEVPFLDIIMKNHFNDFLGGISIIAYVNLVLSLKKNKPYRMESFGLVAVAIILIGLFWEVISPLYLPNSTGDPLDIIAYFAGGCAYYGINRLVTVCAEQNKNSSA